MSEETFNMCCKRLIYTVNFLPVVLSLRLGQTYLFKRPSESCVRFVGRCRFGHKKLEIGTFGPFVDRNSRETNWHHFRHEFVTVFIWSDPPPVGAKTDADRRLPRRLQKAVKWSLAKLCVLIWEGNVDYSNADAGGFRNN